MQLASALSWASTAAWSRFTGCARPLSSLAAAAAAALADGPVQLRTEDTVRLITLAPQLRLQR
jgi:hypothetical protein